MIESPDWLEETAISELARRNTKLVVADGGRIEYAFPVPSVRVKSPTVWSTNKSIDKFTRAKLVKAWRLASKGAATDLEPVEGLWLMTMQLPFTTKRRRDSMNYVGTVVKAVADGITDAGVWVDDTPEYVRVLDPELVVEVPAYWAHVRLVKVGVIQEDQTCLFT